MRSLAGIACWAMRTLWLPGMDHAGISTQVIVERELAKEHLTRVELGREAFERRAWEWKAHSGGTIKQQMIRLGDSVDWSREKFTLDPPLYRAVLEAFLRLYREGLIYRGRYIVNWCPRCQTALSDLERRTRRAQRAPLALPLSGDRDTTRHCGGYHASRDDARRHRRRGASR